MDIKRANQDDVSSFYSEKNSIETLTSRCLLFFNPNESVAYGETQSKSVSWEEEEVNMLEAENQPNNMLLNELPPENFLLQNNQTIESHVTQIKFYLLMFLLFNGFQLLYEIINDIDTYKNYDDYLVEVEEFYRHVHVINIKIFFATIFVLDILWQIVFYSLCFYGFIVKRIRVFDLLNFLALIGVIIQMMQAYIQQFDIYVFFARFLNFSFTKLIFDYLLTLYILL